MDLPPHLARHHHRHRQHPHPPEHTHMSNSHETLNGHDLRQLLVSLVPYQQLIVSDAYHRQCCGCHIFSIYFTLLCKAPDYCSNA